MRNNHSEREREVAQAAKKESKSTKTQGSSGEGSKPIPPSSYKAFEAQDGVTLHLMFKNAEGEEVHSIKMEKKVFSTGSYGWTLSDKAVVDNGEGGTMAVILSGNCK